MASVQFSFVHNEADNIREQVWYDSRAVMVWITISLQSNNASTKVDAVSLWNWVGTSGCSLESERLKRAIAMTDRIETVKHARKAGGEPKKASSFAF
jgi:hypothetical protein